MTVKTGQAWAGAFVTLDATGALAAASVGPAGTLYVDGVATADVVTISGANPYKFAVTLPALTAGQSVGLYVTATVGGIATAAFVATEQADTLYVSDTLSANAVQISGDATAADRLETMLDGTGGNVLTLAQLRINSTAAGGAVDIDNSVGAGIQVTALAGNGIEALGATAALTMAAIPPSTSAVSIIGDVVSSDDLIFNSIQSNLAGYVEGVTNEVTADVAKISGDAGAADNLETMLDGGGGGTLSLGRLVISANGGPAVFVYSNSNVGAVQIWADSPAAPGIRFQGTGYALQVDASLGLSSLVAGLTSLAAWLAALAGKTADGATLAEIQAQTAGATYDNTTDSLEAQSGAGPACAGAGAITFTYTVTNANTGLPIAGVDIWVSTDVAGLNVVANGVSNVLGQVVFYLDAGTYYLWRQLAGWNFTNPDTEVVS